MAAIEAGTSRRRTAARCGVGVSSAIRWHDGFRQEGRIEPKPMGGDQRSQAIEAQAEQVIALYEERPESFLWELRDALAEQGVTTSTSGLSRFFARHTITRKKRRRTRPSRSGQM